jgi:hypothetical protein
MPSTPPYCRHYRQRQKSLLPDPIDIAIERFSSLEVVMEGFGLGLPPRAPDEPLLCSAERNLDYTCNVVGRGEESQNTADRLHSTFRSAHTTVVVALLVVAVVAAVLVVAAASADSTVSRTSQWQLAPKEPRPPPKSSAIGRGPTAGRTPRHATMQHLKCVLFFSPSAAEEYNFLVLSGLQSGFIDFEMAAALHHESIQTARMNVLSLEGINGGPGRAKGRISAVRPPPLPGRHLKRRQHRPR